uniref:Three prime histone mRNA exonuclease 1 n=1 Tax=Schistosoma japonicum TaxID=6182 RepID=C1LG67_SCHJA|nr:three prime histone mRNA exonuclease 1 [Schistosoma japonicum]
MNQPNSIAFNFLSGYNGNINHTCQEVPNINHYNEVNNLLESHQTETQNDIQQLDNELYIQNLIDAENSNNPNSLVNSEILQTNQHSSLFLHSSASDVELFNLEELLARTLISDVYLGPVKSNDGKIISLDTERRTIFNNSLSSSPYSSASLARPPPDIQIITEMWSTFLRDRLSHCNTRIQNMSADVLRTCLHEHNLNQLGNDTVLKRRLQEFVRRARIAQSIDHNTEIRISDDDGGNNENNSFGYVHYGSSVLGEVCLNSQMTNSCGDNDKTKLKDSSITTLIKLQKPVILTPDTFYDYLLIIDLEATCESKEKIINDIDYPHEIIEFPILLYNTRLRKCVSVFHAYCKPRLHPNLSEFCTDLTQIQQIQVDNALPFSNVLLQVEEWLLKRHKLTQKRCAIVCDCCADMSKFMRIQCRLANISLPNWCKIWINLSKSFRAFYKFPSRYRVTLNGMLHDLGLSFVGQRHRGLDDAVNILRIVRVLLSDGCSLRVNERIDMNRPPSFVSSIPRHVAQVTSGLMGSKLILLSPSPRKNKSCNGNNCQNRNVENKRMSPSDLDDNHRESLLWLANIQKTRIHRDK